MSVQRLALLQQAASCIEESSEPPAEEVSLIGSLREDADSARAKLLKAQKRYWKVWQVNLAIRNASYQPFLERNQGTHFDFMHNFEPELEVCTGSDGDNIPLNTDREDDDLLDERSAAQTAECLAAIDLDSQRIAQRDQLLAAAREQLEARKRVEAAAEVAPGVAGEALQVERQVKQQVRRQMQMDEEELRRTVKQYENHELAQVKLKYQETLERSRFQSQNTLRHKVLFEEAWEALQLVVEDADLLASLHNPDGSTGGDRSSTGPFAPRATTFLEDPAGEMQKHDLMREMATQWLQEELDGVRHLCFAEQTVVKDNSSPSMADSVSQGRVVIKNRSPELPDIFAGFRVLAGTGECTADAESMVMCPNFEGRLPWFTGMETTT